MQEKCPVRDIFFLIKIWVYIFRKKFEIFRIIDEDLDAELQSEFVKIEIQACDFGFGDIVRHVLMGFNGLDSVSSDELTFSAALSVGFKDIDGFDIILNL